MHVFDAARSMLEKKGFIGMFFALHQPIANPLTIPRTVVGGFLSPSHDDYVMGKLGNEAIPAVHRLAMIERALASSDWISAEPWEATIPYFVSFHQVRGACMCESASLFLLAPQKVVVEFDRYLRKSIDAPIQVMYVCGADLIVRCRYFTSLGPFPVVRLAFHERAARQ